MPRITKEEVRAAVQNKKNRSEDKGEEVSKEELSYPIISEELQTFEGVENENKKVKNKRKNKTFSNNDETKNREHLEVAKESEKERYFAISSKDMQKTNETLAQLQKEKEELETTVTLLETRVSEIDGAEEGFHRKLDQKQEEYNALLNDKEREIGFLKQSMIAKEVEINSLKRKISHKKKILTSKNIGELIAYILAGIISCGILGLLAMIVIKFLLSVWNWLF